MIERVYGGRRHLRTKRELGKYRRPGERI